MCIRDRCEGGARGAARAAPPARDARPAPRPGDALPLPLEAPCMGPLRHGIGPVHLRRAGRVALGGAAPPPSLAGVVPARRAGALRGGSAVSYTHLTLPTIYS